MVSQEHEALILLLREAGARRGAFAQLARRTPSRVTGPRRYDPCSSTRDGHRLRAHGGPNFLDVSGALFHGAPFARLSPPKGYAALDGA